MGAGTHAGAPAARPSAAGPAAAGHAGPVQDRQKRQIRRTTFFCPDSNEWAVLCLQLGFLAHVDPGAERNTRWTAYGLPRVVEAAVFLRENLYLPANLYPPGNYPYHYQYHYHYYHYLLDTLQSDTLQLDALQLGLLDHLQPDTLQLDRLDHLSFDSLHIMERGLR